MKHPLVGVCRPVAEGGNLSPAGRQEDSLNGSGNCLRVKPVSPP
jgi:hypothetical protein